MDQRDKITDRDRDRDASGEKNNNERTSHETTPCRTPPPLIYLEGELLNLDPDVPEIHKAVFDGDLERLKALVESGADVNEPNPEGWPPLHTAIKAGNMPCAAYLIKCGASDFYDRQQAEYNKRLNTSARVSGRKHGGSH